MAEKQEAFLAVIQESERRVVARRAEEEKIQYEKMIYCDRSKKSVNNGMNYGREMSEWLLVKRLWKSSWKINGKGSATQV